MKKIILVIGMLVFSQLCFSELTQDTTHHFKLIKLTEDAITDDSYKPIAGKEKLLAVKVVDESGKGVFGAEVRFEIVAGGGYFIESLTDDKKNKIIIRRANLYGECNIVYKLSEIPERNTVKVSITKTGESIEIKFDSIILENKKIKNTFRKINENDSKIGETEENIQETKGNQKKRHNKKKNYAKGMFFKLVDIPDEQLNDWDIIAYNQKSKVKVIRYRNQKQETIFPMTYYIVDGNKGIVIREERYIQIGIVGLYKDVIENSDWQFNSEKKAWISNYNRRIFYKGLKDKQEETSEKIINRKFFKGGR